MTGTSSDVPQCALKASHYCGHWASSSYLGLLLQRSQSGCRRYQPWSTIDGSRVERSVVGPQRGQCPIVQSPQPTLQPSNPPTPLKSPPRKSWVAINQSTKYQCPATNKQNENTNQPTQIAARGHRVLGIVGLSV